MVPPIVRRDHLEGQRRQDGAPARDRDNAGWRCRLHAGGYPPPGLFEEAFDAARLGEWIAEGSRAHSQWRGPGGGGSILEPAEGANPRGEETGKSPDACVMGVEAKPFGSPMTFRWVRNDAVACREPTLARPDGYVRDIGTCMPLLQRQF